MDRVVMDWGQIDVVLLDMDGTLLDLHFDNFFWRDYLPAACAVAWGMDRIEAERRLFAQFRAVQGTLDWYCLDYWQRELGLDVVALKREIQHLIAVRPGVWDFLQVLRDLGKRRVLVTNAHRGSLALKMELTGMAPWLDRLISTHDLGYPKEEQRFWQELSAREPFDPARTLFVDDTLKILDAARLFGVRHLWSILLPDSRGEPHPPSAYPQIRSFHPLVLDPPLILG